MFTLSSYCQFPKKLYQFRLLPEVHKRIVRLFFVFVFVLILALLRDSYRHLIVLLIYISLMI